MDKLPPLKVKPLTATTWPDFEALFESKGGPKYCWCMVWRKMEEGASPENKAARKRSLHTQVKKRTATGLLAYHDGEPVAWCSVAPRESYTNLGGDEELENLWSVVCFFIKRDYRRLGMAEFLLKEAEKYAKKRKARFLEAYPVKPDSPSYRFMGFIPMYERAGYRHVKKAGSRRYVMVKEL